MDSPSQRPHHLFPPRIYELTYQMLKHAVHAEMGNLIGIQLSESADTCHLIVDQCIALADCILDRRTEAPWPPSEKVIRVFANLTVTGLENSGEKIAHTGPPAATSDAVYTYLARVVVEGEPATHVFPPGESVILPAWTTAAMLVSLLPKGASTWQDHLQMIWDLETTDGVNYAALAAIHSRARRREVRPTSEKKLSERSEATHQPLAISYSVVNPITGISVRCLATPVHCSQTEIRLLLDVQPAKASGSPPVREHQRRP